MRKYLILFLLAAYPASAQIKTITGGGYQYPNGSPCASCTLTLQLTSDATVSGTGQIVPKLLSYILDGSGNVPSGSTVWGNDQLQPNGTTYKASLAAVGGGQLWGPEYLFIGGTSPINLAQLIPVSSPAVFFSNPVVTSGNNTFTGTNIFTAITSASANPSITGFLRMSNTDALGWRNNANNADILLRKTGVASGQAANDMLDTTQFGGLTSGNFNSGSSATAAAGLFRMANSEGLFWRNNGNSADIGLTKDNGDNLNLQSFAGMDWQGGHLVASTAAPTFGSGFNAGSIGPNPNGTMAFSVIIGVGAAVSTGTVNLPTAANFWTCFAQNVTRPGVIQLTASTNTSASFQNFGTTFVATNWTNSDAIHIYCWAR
jgi:hypothetical protein